MGTRGRVHPRTAPDRRCPQPQRVATPANQRSRQMLRRLEDIGLLPERNVAATRSGAVHVFAPKGSGVMEALTDAQIGPGHGIQAGLGLAGEAREDKGNVKTGVFVAVAGNHHAGTIEFAPVARGLQ